MNVRALPVPLTLPRIRWPLLVAGIGALAAVNFIVLWDSFTFAGLDTRHQPLDFYMLVHAGERVWSGELYQASEGYAFRWSPIAAYLLTPLQTTDLQWWRMGLLAMALTMPTRLMSGVLLLSAPFWVDFDWGNLVTLQLWLAAWAIVGNRWASYGYLAVALLVPRPLILPVAVWLLWKRPELRWPFVAMFGVHLLAVAVTGYGPEWVSVLISSSSEIGLSSQISPSTLIGAWWIPIGSLLAAVLVWRGHLGLASLAAAPYWIGYYLMFGLLELVKGYGSVTRNQSQ